MKNIWKKTAAIGLSVMMAAAMAACGGSSSDKPAQTESAAAGGDASYTVGVCQLVQHVALDAATQGFQDAITVRNI